MGFKNNIVSLEYFRANMEDLEKLKDKNLFKAILSLVKFQVGNYLLNDTNTLKIDSISPHTVFAFNTALIKDIALSYDELEQSMVVVYNSEYKDLLEDKLVIANKEVFIQKDSLNNTYIYDKEQYEYLQEEFKDLISEEHGIFINSSRLTLETYLEDRGLKVKLLEGYGNGGHELGYKNKIFADNSLLEYQMEERNTKEIKGKFLAKDIYKIKSNKLYYADSSTGARLDMSPRLNFINTAYLELTGLDKYKFNIINNKLQKFIYGYLTNEISYVKSESKGRIRRTLNSEYSKTRMEGKELFEHFKEELEIFTNKLEYGIKLNKSKEELLNEIYTGLTNRFSQKTMTMFDKLTISIFNNVNKEDTIENISSYIVSEMKKFYENIDKFFYLNEKNTSLINSIKIANYSIEGNKLKEKIQDIVAIALTNKVEIDDTEGLLKKYNVVNFTEGDAYKISQFSNELSLKLKEKLDENLEKEFPYHFSFYNEKAENAKENNFFKICDFLSGYSYIDYSVSAYTKIRQNENIITDEHDIEDINRILKNFISRARAGIYDLKVDSYILNLKENSELPMMNESLQKLYENDELIKEIIDNLKENKYYDMFEIDKDFLNGTNPNENKEINRQKLLEFSKGINHLELPVNIKNTFKIRKLGNYGGKNKTITGLYSDFAGQITVDTRRDVFFHSVKHEEIHRMDLNNINKIGRNNLISLLDKYFDEKIPNSEMKNYYLIPEELIARAGEVTCMLLAGNYKIHYSSYERREINEVEMWEKVKADFENSKDYVLMKSFDKYLKGDEYIDFKNIIDANSLENQLLEICFEYYKPFFNKEKTDIVKLLKQSPKVGYENRQIEGLDTKKLDTSWNIYFNKNDMKEMLNLITKKMSITPLEIPSFEKIEKNDIRPLKNVLLDFANNYGDINELQIHINGKGFESNPLEKLEDDLLLSTIKNRTIMKMITGDNQLNIKNLLNRINEIENPKSKDEMFFELLDTVIDIKIDLIEIKKFEEKYLEILHGAENSISNFTKEDENLMYHEIAKQFGHREDSNTKNMGEGLFNRYCLGDDFSQNAKEFDSFKNSCDSLKYIKHYKGNNNESYYLQNLVKYSNNFLSFDKKNTESLLSIIIDSNQNNNNKNILLADLKEKTSSGLNPFADALVNFIFTDKLAKLEKENFEILSIDVDKISEYAQRYRDINNEKEFYTKNIEKNPLFYYEKIVDFYNKNELPFSKLKFIHELVSEFIKYKFSDDSIMNFKVKNKILLEKKDLEFNAIFENDRYANFSILLNNNLFEYKDITQIDILKAIENSREYSSPRTFPNMLRKSLELSLLQDDFTKLNEILKLNIGKEDKNNELDFKAKGITFNIDIPIRKQGFELENKVFEINENHITFIDESIGDYRENRLHTKSTELTKAYLALKNEDYDNANQRLQRFGDICGGIFVALNDNTNSDYFSRFNELYRDIYTEDEIKDFEKITFTENDFILKINKYIEHYFVDTKLNKFQRDEKKEFLSQICVFSNKIDENNIIDSIQCKRVPRKILSKIFDEDFFNNWSPKKIKITDIQDDDIDTNFLTIKEENMNKINEKVNKILNNLDFLSINTRKNLADSFKKDFSRKVMISENIKYNYKDINDKINCLKKHDKGEFIACKLKLYEMYVFDFIVNNKDSEMIPNLIALDNKMKFHFHRTEILNYSNNQVDLNKKESHENILINGIAFIDKIINTNLNLIDEISLCRDFVSLANNINKIIESSGVNTDDGINNKISNETNINNSIAI